MMMMIKCARFDWWNY